MIFKKYITYRFLRFIPSQIAKENVHKRQNLPAYLLLHSLLSPSLYMYKEDMSSRGTIWYESTITSLSQKF